MLGGLIPPSLATKPKDTHQDVSQRVILPSLPSPAAQRGGNSPGAQDPVEPCASPAHFPLPQAGTGLLQLTYALPTPSKPFTTHTPKAKGSLTSAILLLGAWSFFTGREQGTFLTLQRPFSPYGRDPGRWLPLTGCRTRATQAQHEPGQPCPHYGPCSATIAYRCYLFYLICKYRKDVVLFIWSIHLYIPF